MTEVLNTLKALKERPQMFFNDPLNTQNVDAFLLGYLSALSIYFSKNLNTEFFFWYRKKINFNYNGITTIEATKKVNPNKVDADIALLLIEAVEEFFVANPQYATVAAQK